MSLSRALCRFLFLAVIAEASASQPLNKKISMPVSSTGTAVVAHSDGMMRREAGKMSQSSYHFSLGQKSNSTGANRLSCAFTIDYQVDSVWYNGVDLTSTVKHMDGDDSHLWALEKSIEIPQVVKNAYLTITGHTKNPNDDGCQAGFFAMYCNNEVSSSDPTLQAYASDQMPDHDHMKGHGEHWGEPCMTGNTGAFLTSHPTAAKIFAAKQYATFRVMPIRDAEITGTPAPRVQYVEQYWANWSGYVREGQNILEEKCSPGNYIVSWVMLCAAPHLEKITGGPSVGVDRFIRAECSDGATLGVEQGGQNGAAHTMVWPNGRDQVQMRFGKTTTQVMTQFDTCGGVSEGESTSYIQQCPQDICPNCTISGFGVRYEYHIEGFRIFCQKTLPLEKAAEAVGHTIQTVQHAIDTANTQILSSAQDVNRATDQLTAAKADEQKAEAASDNAYQTAMSAVTNAGEAEGDAKSAVDGSAKAEAWSQTASNDAQSADVLAHNAAQNEQLVSSDISNKETQIQQGLNQIKVGIEANSEVSQQNAEQSQKAADIVNQAEVMVDAASKDSNLVSNKEAATAQDVENFEHGASGAEKDSEKAEKDAQKAKLGGMAAVGDTEKALSGAEKETAVDNAKIAKLFKDMSGLAGFETASKEDQKLMMEIMMQAANDTRRGAAAAKETEMMYQSSSKLSSEAADDAATASKSELQAKNAAAETNIGLNDVRGLAYQGKIADEESAREDQTTQDEVLDTLQTAHMTRETLAKVMEYALKTNQSMAQAKRDLGYIESVKGNIEGELTHDMTSLGREMTEAKIHKITHAVTAAHVAHHDADVANGVAQTALNQAAVAMSGAHSRIVESQHARETAHKELAEAQQDMDDISVEAAKTKEMQHEAEAALKKTEADDQAAKDAVAAAQHSAAAADAQVSRGSEMLGEVDSAQKKAAESQEQAGVALHAVQGSLNQIRADQETAERAKAQASTALAAAENLRAETEEARKATDAAVQEATQAADVSRSAIANSKADAEAQKTDREAAEKAAEESEAALQDTRQAGSASLEAQKAAEAAIGEVKGAHEEAETAMAAAHTALNDAKSSTGVAVQAIEEAKQGSVAAKTALQDVATEANAIKALKDDMNNWHTKEMKIKHLLIFLANQSDMNQKTAETLNHTTSGMEKTVTGLEHARTTQQKILTGLAEHTAMDEKIMGVLTKHEQVSDKLMSSIKNNTNVANKSLHSVEAQGEAISKVLDSLESAEKTKNSTITASKAMQTALTKTVGGLEGVNNMLNKTLSTIKGNTDTLNASLQTVGANQQTLGSVVEGITKNVEAQDKSLAASRANTETLGKALNMIHQGHEQDKSMLAALRKMEESDEAQMAASDAHSEVDAATLNTLGQAQSTDDKLVASVAKTQVAQKKTLDAIKAQEGAMSATLTTIEQKHKALGKILTGVQKTQMSQGAQLNALGGNSKLIRAAVGTVQHNQLTDERVLNDLSGLDRQEHSDSEHLAGAISGFQARIKGAEDQERRDSILFNSEAGQDRQLNTEVSGLAQQERLMEGNEIKQKQDLMQASQRQQDVMNVQNIHRQAMLKLAKVQYQSVQYLEGVAGKVVQGETDLKTLQGRMHGIETGIVDMEGKQKASENNLQRLDAAEAHMAQNVFGVEQRSIHDHSALKLEQEAQSHVQKASDSVYHQEEDNLHRMDQMEHAVHGGFGEASFEHNMPAMQSRMRQLKGDLQVIQSDEEATRTQISAMGRKEEQDVQQIRGDLSHDQAELMRTAKKGADLDSSIHSAERMEHEYGESVHEEEHELESDEHRLEDEGKHAASMSKTADGMDVESVKNDVAGVGQKAAAATTMAQNYWKGVEHAKAEEQRIEGAMATAGKDLGDLNKDKVSMENEITSLSKEEQAFQDKRQGEFERNLEAAENKIDIKIKGMQKLAGPGIDNQVHQLENQQTQKQEEVGALNNGIKTEKGVMDKVEKKNDESKEMDQTLEDHQRRLKENVDAIEAQAQQAATNIHILAGGLLVFVLISAVLHNMWRGKIDELDKDL